MLEEAGVEYVVVGGYAVAFHGFARATGDLDVFVRATPENARRVFQGLKRFGAPLSTVRVDDFASPGTVFQFGREPKRIDILNAISGVTFSEAWDQRVTTTTAGISLKLIGAEALMKNKKAAARPKDLLDVAELEAQRTRGSPPHDPSQSKPSGSDRNEP
ncbi:MAG: nucleotidyltransferase [Deltaproteobacteria bacterium]|nr:nucleotidyltransferase [Deltaproteobacteria bacterium]